MNLLISVEVYLAKNVLFEFEMQKFRPLLSKVVSASDRGLSDKFTTILVLEIIFTFFLEAL